MGGRVQGFWALIQLEQMSIGEPAMSLWVHHPDLGDIFFLIIVIGEISGTNPG